MKSISISNPAITENRMFDRQSACPSYQFKSEGCGKQKLVATVLANKSSTHHTTITPKSNFKQIWLLVLKTKH